METLTGKVAAVTGATSGSGLGVVKSLLGGGCTVVMLARGEQRLVETAADLGSEAVPVVCDVTDPEHVSRAFGELRDRFGKLDVLVNNAAVYRPCAVENLSDADIGQQVSTNLLGAVHTCRAAIPLMRSAGGGDIVNTSSESTVGDPFPMLSMYIASKAGLEAFSRVLAREVAPDEIRVTTLVQGVATGPGGGPTDWGWDETYGPEAIKLWTELGLMQRAFGLQGSQNAEEVGEVVRFIVTRPRSQQLDTVFCRSF